MSQLVELAFRINRSGDANEIFGNELKFSSHGHITLRRNNRCHLNGNFNLSFFHEYRVLLQKYRKVKVQVVKRWNCKFAIHYGLMKGLKLVQLAYASFQNQKIEAFQR